MRLLKILSIILIPLVLLAVISYLNRCRLAEALIDIGLKRADLRPVALRINEIGLTGLIINNLSLSKSTPDGEMFLDMKHMSVRYTPAALLGGGVDALTVDKLKITLPDPEPPKERTPTLADIPDHIFIPPLPPCEFTVQTLVIKGRQMGPLDSRTLHLHGTMNPNKGEFTLTHPSDPYGPTIITGVAELLSGHLSLELRRESEAMEPALKLDLNLESHVLSGLCTIDLHETRTILAPFFAIRSLPELHGLVNLRLLVKREENKEFSFEIETESDQSGTEQYELESAVMGLAGRLREPEPGHLLLSAEPGLTLKGRNIRYRDMEVELLTAHLSANIENRDGQTGFNLIGQPLITLNGIKTDNLQLDELTLHPLLELTQHKDRYSLACWPPFDVELAGLNTSEINANGRIKFSAGERFEAEFNLEPQFSMSAKKGSWNLVTDDFKLNEIEFGANTLAISHDNLDFNPIAPSWSANLHTKDFKLKAPGVGRLLFKDIDLDLAGRLDGITISGYLVPNNHTGQLNINLAHQLSSGTGTVRINTVEPLTFSPMAPLSSLVEALPFPLEINQGRLGLTSKFHWAENKPLIASTELNVTGLGGIYDEISFQGLTLTGAWDTLPSLKSNTPLNLSLAELQCGIPITDISIQARLPHADQPFVAVDQLNADLLGGHIIGTDIRYIHGAELNTFGLQIHGLDLANVASTMNLGESMELSGKVDGTIPLELTDEGFRIHDGVFLNQKTGGIIRYLSGPQSGLGQSPLTAVIQKALEDFHYNLLKASADYKPSGELQVAIHMEGKSPRLDSDRPVHINLNTEQNILSLLKSLRYSKAMTDELNKKIQQKYSK